jgi:alcohol dehydrogenase
MRQLQYVGDGRLTWIDVPEPEITTPAAALVRPLAVASCDLDAAVMDGRAPIPGPYPFGHEFVGEVVAVGADAQRVRTGDVVAVPFQISCGTCRRCVTGLTGNCESVTSRASYGLGLLGGLEWGGAVTDLIAVPFADAMAVPVPAGISPAAVASLSDNLPDAYRAIGPHRDHAEEALIVGGASIGLYATQIAIALGMRVRYVDTDGARLRVAESAGATVVQGPMAAPVEAAPLVVHTSGDPDQLRSAWRSVDHGGVLVDTGIYFGNNVELPLLDAYGRGFSFTTGRAHARRDMPAVLDLVVSGRLNPAQVTSAVVPWEEAAEALAAPGTKTVVTRT